MNLLRLLLPENRYEAFLGDLDEEFATHSHSRLWYWKEMILMIVHSTSRWIAFAVVGGFIAGSAMTGLDLLHQRPLFILLPYAVIIISTAALLRARSYFPFLTRFMILLVAYMVASATAFYGLRLDSGVAEPPPAFQFLILGVIFVIGSVSSACAAIVSSRNPNAYLSAVALGILGAGAMIIAAKWSNFIPISLAFVLLLIATTLVLRQTRRRPMEQFAITLIASSIAEAGFFLFVALTARHPGDAMRFWNLTWLPALICMVAGSLTVAAVNRFSRSRVSS